MTHSARQHSSWHCYLPPLRLLPSRLHPASCIGCFPRRWHCLGPPCCGPNIYVNDHTACLCLLLLFYYFLAPPALVCGQTANSHPCAHTTTRTRAHTRPAFRQGLGEGLGQTVQARSSTVPAEGKQKKKKASPSDRTHQAPMATARTCRTTRTRIQPPLPHTLRCNALLPRRNSTARTFLTPTTRTRHTLPYCVARARACQENSLRSSPAHLRAPLLTYRIRG